MLEQTVSEALFGQYCTAEIRKYISIIMVRKGQFPKDARQTIITLKSEGIREIAKKAMVSVSTASTPSKGTWKLEETLTGRDLAESEDKFQRVNSLRDSNTGHQLHAQIKAEVGNFYKNVF